MRSRPSAKSGVLGLRTGCRGKHGRSAQGEEAGHSTRLSLPQNGKVDLPKESRRGHGEAGCPDEGFPMGVSEDVSPQPGKDAGAERRVGLSFLPFAGSQGRTIPVDDSPAQPDGGSPSPQRRRSRFHFDHRRFRVRLRCDPLKRKRRIAHQNHLRKIRCRVAGGPERSPERVSGDQQFSARTLGADPRELPPGIEIRLFANSSGPGARKNLLSGASSTTFKDSTGLGVGGSRMQTGAHRGGVKRGRYAVAQGELLGISARPGGLRGDHEALPSKRRRLCEPQQLQAPEVSLGRRGREPFVLRLQTSSRREVVPLPTGCPVDQSDSENLGDQDAGHPDFSPVENCRLVPFVAEHHKGPDSPAASKSLVGRRRRPPAALCLGRGVVRPPGEQPSTKSTDAPAILNMLLRARIAESTRAAYRSHWKTWSDFCSVAGIDVLNFSEQALLGFALKLYSENRNALYIQNALSALRFFAKENFQPLSPFASTMVRDAIKGAKRLRPSLPRYQVDPNFTSLLPVFCQCCQENGSFTRSLERAVFLCAFCGLMRPADMAAVQFKNIVKSPSRWTLIGASKEGRGALTRRFLDKEADGRVCPVRALDQFIALRPSLTSSDRLFVNGEGAALSAQAISRVIRGIFSRMKVDFRPYVLRMAGVNALIERGIPVQDVFIRGGWSSFSCFSKHYARRSCPSTTSAQYSN
eukprot:TRINITY_DN1474_c0_g1_i1.p1 TRINITY_DN1474_c0_g1~~TRINITY_DN1474_c0_g1_i1.p1  ORF type:complete len:695 (-),score=38.87 TRINITY_DN1474_c0_g1_i1:83-2167(-)